MIGGLGKHVGDLVPALAHEDVEVHVVTPNLADAASEEVIAVGATVHRVPVSPATTDHSGIAFVRAVNEQLAQAAAALHSLYGPFDLVHSHDWLTSFGGIALKHRFRLPLVATLHGTERGRWQGHLHTDQSLVIDAAEWTLTYEAWRVITVSAFMREQLHASFSLPLDKIDVVQNGVTLPAGAMLAPHERAAFRRRWADDDAPIIFYVGRVVHEKGIQVLIEAVPCIRARHPTARVVVAGTGARLDDLRQYARERGVADVVQFTGFISDEERDRLYEVATVAAFPSLYEPFGIVALEAMVHCCPVVVAATGGLREVVRLWDNGMTAHPGDAASLAWAINATLADPVAARWRAERAWREVQECYNWQQIARSTVDVYERVQSARRRSEWASPQIEQVA